MITTLFLDIDGTILDFKAAEHAAFCRSMEQHGIQTAEELYPRYSAFNRSLWEALERGELTRDELLGQRYGRFFAMEQISCDPKAFEDTYRENLNDMHFLMDGAMEILEYLYEKYPLFVVTNGIAHTQYRRIGDAKIGRFFQKLFISEEIGCSKPDPRFFAHALAHAGNPDPKEVLIIGDSLTSDMLGGYQAGLRTCWLRTEETVAVPSFPIDYTITHLSQLRDIL